MLWYLVSAPSPSPRLLSTPIAVATPVPRKPSEWGHGLTPITHPDVSRSSAEAVLSVFLSLQAPCGLRCGVSWVSDICLVPGKIQDGWWQASAAGLGGWMSLAELPQYHCSGHSKLQGDTERKVFGLSHSQSYQLYTSLQGVQGTCSKSTCKRLKQLAERLKVPALGPGQPTEFCKQHFI